MHKSKIGHLRIELEMTDEVRSKLMELASGQGDSVMISDALVKHVRVYHLQTQATRVKELEYRKVHVHRLELSASRPTLFVGP